MKSLCKTCPTAEDCKTAFGKFWGERSRGGVGCDRPFRYDRSAVRDADDAADERSHAKQESFL